MQTKHNAEHQRTAPSTEYKGPGRYFTGRIFLQTAQNIAIIQQTQTKTRDPVPIFTFVPELFVNAGNDFPRQFLDIL